MEVDEFFNTRLHLMVLLRSLVESQHDGRNVTEDSGTHEG